MQYVYVLMGDVDYEPGTTLGVFGSQAAMMAWIDEAREEARRDRMPADLVATLGYDELTCITTALDVPADMRYYSVATRP